MHAGIDTGGTFTDLVAYDADARTLAVVKVPSTPRAPADAVATAVRELGPAAAGIRRIVVGSTIAINAILQRKGADVLYLTTAGFEDIPYIQRINRRHLYDLQWQKGEPLVRRSRTIGVRERVDYRGEIVERLGEDEIARVCNELERLIAQANEPAIAISLLFAYVNPVHEQLLIEAIERRFPSLPISASSRVAPIWREYERGSTTIADAYVKPIIAGFARALSHELRQARVTAPISLMKSNGGQLPADSAADHSSELVLSGLAGGLLAGKYYADLLGHLDVITLDMGGTSADVGVVHRGRISFSESYDIDWAIPIIGSFVDMTTIGAGGSSIAGFDRGGFLKVGPESAGADPGPASYGTGSTEATLTDANLVLGRLNPHFFLGGRMPLSVARARDAIRRIADGLGASLEDAAVAVIRMANENMANAVRLLTVDRGLDHREFDLLAFGGAGPLHAAELAGDLSIRRVLVPVHPGLTSAFGVMAANPRVDRRWTCSLTSETTTAAQLRDAFGRLVADAVDEVRSEGYEGEVQIARTVKMRYFGQNYEQEIAVPEGDVEDATIGGLVERFHSQHESFYGYAMRENVCELAQLNVTVQGLAEPPSLPPLSRGEAPSPSTVRGVYFAGDGWVESRIYFRDALAAGARIDGPAVVEELDSTTLVHPSQHLAVDNRGVLYLELANGQPSATGVLAERGSP